MTRPYRVALCGYYGFGNLGDELLAASLVEACAEEGIPRREIALLSASPVASARTLGVTAVPRWNVGAVFSLLRMSDTLLLGGGGLFQDATSVRSCLWYWGVVRLALLAGARPWAVGQSVGPFCTAPGKWFAENALRACTALGVRDQRSRDLLSLWNIESLLTPDPVFSLPFPEIRSGPPSSGPLLVNIRPWRGDLPDRTASEATRLAERAGLPLKGVALAEEDLRLMEDQRERGILSAPEILLLTEENWREEENRTLASASGAVAMRYHFALLALRSGLPLTLAAYDPKVESLGREWSLPSWKGEGELPPPVAPDRGRALLQRERFLTDFRSLLKSVLPALYKKEMVLP